MKVALGKPLEWIGMFKCLVELFRHGVSDLFLHVPVYKVSTAYWGILMAKHACVLTGSPGFLNLFWLGIGLKDN